MIQRIIIILFLVLSTNVKGQVDCFTAQEFDGSFCSGSFNQNGFEHYFIFTHLNPNTNFTDFNLGGLIDFGCYSNGSLRFILFSNECFPLDTNNTGLFYNINYGQSYVLYVTFSCIISFNNYCILPIELYSFDGYQNNNTVLIEWITLSETNNNHFLVQHSTDNENWNTISTVYSLGDSYSERFYQIKHEKPIAGANYYRLISVDIDKNPEISKTIVVYFRERILNILKYNVLGQKIIE